MSEICLYAVAGASGSTRIRKAPKHLYCLKSDFAEQWSGRHISTVRMCLGAENDADDGMPMVLEALPAEGVPTAEPASPDLLVFTVPGLAVSLPTALGPGRYLPVFLSERQRDAALV